MQEAINHGLVILGWFENYMGNELPQENLWDDGEYIEKHFNAVRDKKQLEMGGSPFADAEGSTEDLMKNDLASVFKD